MNAVETVKVKIKQIASNKGNMGPFILAYVVWIAAMTWIFWLPLPSARTQPDVFGTHRVVACLTVIMHYVKCAMFMNLITSAIAIILRVGVIFLAPPLAVAIFQGVTDHCNKNPPA
jgi:ATP/ADP translocase